MKKVYSLIISILFIANYIFAENSYYYLNLYKPYGREATWTEEIEFYDDGLIKQITHYDINEACDFYNWKSIKSKLKILRQYKVERSKSSINVILLENDTERIAATIENLNTTEFKYTQFINNNFSYSINASKSEISNTFYNLPKVLI